MLCLAILLSLISCGRKPPENPIEAVPPGCSQVTVIDLQRLAAANGANSLVADGSLTPAAEDAIAMLLPTDLLRPLAAVVSIGDNGVDTHQAEMFTTSRGYDGLILKVTSRQQLADAMHPYRDASSDFGEYDTYTTGKRLIAISDHLCVIAPDAATIKTIGQKGDGGIISGMAGINEFLSSKDNSIR